MAICCPKSVRALALRLTRQDDCGAPIPEGTPNSRIATSAFVSLGMSPDIEAGEEIIVKNASGAICIQDQDCDRVKGFNLTLMLCGVPMPVLEMLIGVDLLLDPLVPTDVIGGVIPDRNTSLACDDTVQLDLWSKNAEKGDCGPTQRNTYIRWAIVKALKWQLSGDITFSNTALEFELTGYAENNPLWDSSIAGEWDPTHVAQIQAGGPLAWACTPDLPPDVDDCAYVP